MLRGQDFTDCRPQNLTQIILAEGSEVLNINLRCKLSRVELAQGAAEVEFNEKET